MEAPAPLRAQSKKAAILYWLLTSGWCGLIFWSSHQPSSGLELPFAHFDKLLHFGTYALLGAFLRMSLGSHSYGFWLAVLIGSLYGISDEFHQSFVPGRDTDLFDWFADCVGVVVGAYWGITVFSRRTIEG